MNNDLSATIVERDEIVVMLKRTSDTQEAITAAWTDVEERVGSLRARKFYGVFDPSTNEYRVCVEIRAGDDPTALGLEPGTIPGGRYARVRLQGEPPGLYAHIAPTFERLAQREDHDPTRPDIEFYRRRDAVDLLLPIS